MGRGGITDEKREGDGKTPEGTYRFTMPFGLKDDPGAKLPYHKVRQGDFWVDDSQSAHYNRLVNTSETAKDWNSAENLATSYTVYNYALALNYNEECVPPSGGAGQRTGDVRHRADPDHHCQRLRTSALKREIMEIVRLC